jgi:hypothetical protein
MREVLFVREAGDLALATSHLAQSSSASRVTAAQAGFFILSSRANAPSAALAGDNPEAVVLDLVQPIASGRQLVGFGRETRRDESGREGTLQHAK